MVDLSPPRPSLDPLAALSAFHRAAGDIFQVALPGFKLVVMAGPAAGRLVYASQRQHFSWRLPGDAVAKLLRQGVLVTDGAPHDRLRELQEPALQAAALPAYAEPMVNCTDQISRVWPEGGEVDMLVEMRRIALLVIMRTLFGVDFAADLKRLWRPILRAIHFISPGPWLLWRGMPRPGYTRPLAALDAYLYELIRQRRRTLDAGATDLLSRLVAAPGLDDDLIRDQLLTQLIAGHDTGTALMAWTLYLLGRHPASLAQVRSEIDAGLGVEPPEHGSVRDLPLLDRAIRESLRLYPPIHASMRRAVADIEFEGFRIPTGSRVLFSIYLTHRHPALWQEPERFLPERFAGTPPPAFSYVPFGGGPRHCIGGAFGKLEAQIVLARLLQTFDLQLTDPRVHPHMGATLEPRPGVFMRVRRRPS